MPSERSSSTARIIGTLVASTVVLAFALPVGWMLAYFMNDDIQASDHVVFGAVPFIELAVTGLVAGLVIARSAPMRAGRALLGALALVAVPALAFVAAYALLSLTPLLDDAIGSSAGNAVWAGVAALALLLLVVLAWAGSRLLRTPR